MLLLGAAKEGYGQRVYANQYGYSESGDGGLLGADGFVDNPTNALIGPPDNSFTMIRIGNGLLGNAYAIYQMEFFGDGNLPAGTSIYIKIEDNTSDGLLGIALVSQGFISVYSNANSENSSTLIGDLVPLDDSEVVIDGDYLIVTPSHCFNAVQLSIGSGGLLGLGLLTRGNIKIYHAYYECPPPISVVEIPTICTGETATLQVENPIPESSCDYLWYNSATGGTSIGSGSSFTTDELISTTTFYVGYSGVNPEECGRTPVVVTVLPKPGSPRLTIVNEQH